MSVLEELYKIKAAFERVRIDVDELRRAVITLQKEKSEKSTEAYLLEEINSLKSKLKDLESENRKLYVMVESNSSNIKNQQEAHYEDYVIVGHKESKKVHIGSCPYSKKITEENRVVFGLEHEGGEQTAIREGYNRCMCLKDKYKDHQ